MDCEEKGRQTVCLGGIQEQLPGHQAFLDLSHFGPQFIATALLLIGRTPLGALSLSLAFTSESEWQLMFGLGRPIEERSITDSTW